MPFYDGSDTQLAPDAVDTEGVAYRGTALLHSPGFPLEEFGNRIPTLTFDVSSISSAHDGLVKVIEFEEFISLQYDAYFESPAQGQLSGFKVHKFTGGTFGYSAHETWEFDLLSGNSISPKHATTVKTHVSTDTTEGEAISYEMVVGSNVVIVRARRQDVGPRIIWGSAFYGTGVGPLPPATQDYVQVQRVRDDDGNIAFLSVGPNMKSFGTSEGNGRVYMDVDNKLTEFSGNVESKGDTLPSRDGYWRSAYSTNGQGTMLYYCNVGDNKIFRVLGGYTSGGIKKVPLIHSEWTLPGFGATAANWDFDVRDDLLIINGGINQSIGYVNRLRIFRITPAVYPALNQFEDPAGIGAIPLQPATIEELYDHYTFTDLEDFPETGCRWISDRLFITELGVWRWKRNDPGDITLEEVLDSEMEAAGIAADQRDNSAYSDEICQGYVVDTVATARNNCEPLMQRWMFDFVESNYILKAVPRSGAKTPIVIPEDDLRAGPGGGANVEPVTIVEKDETELPRKVIVNYVKAPAVYDAELLAAIEEAAAAGEELEVLDTFEQGSQFAERLVTRATRVQVLDLRISMTATEAKQLAENTLMEAWNRRFSYEWTLGKKYTYTEPTDIFTLPVGGSNVDVMCTLISEEPSGLLSLKGEGYSATSFISAATVVDDGYTLAPVGSAGGTALEFADLPMLNAGDTEFRVYEINGHYTDGWTSVVLYKSLVPADPLQLEADISGFEEYATKSRRTVAGGVYDLPSSPAVLDLIDNATVFSVSLLNSSHTLSSVSTDYLYSDYRVNLAAYGRPGRWELMRFLTATQEEDGTWSLTGLLRGQFGTELNIYQHEQADIFFMVDTGQLDKIPFSINNIGELSYYRGLTDGALVDNLTAATQVVIDYQARNYRPWSPVHISFVDLGASDTEINWVRRARFNNSVMDGLGVPLESDCDPETYDLIIYKADGYVGRTVTVTEPTFTYTSAMKSSDGTGSDFSVVIYQISQLVGRGNASIEAFFNG